VTPALPLAQSSAEGRFTGPENVVPRPFCLRKCLSANDSIFRTVEDRFNAFMNWAAWELYGLTNDWKFKRISVMTNRLIRYTSLISVIGLIAVVLPDVAKGYPSYQCLKTTNGVVYCSSKKLKSHAEGNAWVKKVMAHYNLTANDISGKPFERASQPSNATVFLFCFTPL
jgi:hypothetical protein